MVVDTLRLTLLGLALAVSAVFTVSAQTTGSSSKDAPSAADIKARRAERLELVVANQLEIEEAMVVVYEAVRALSEQEPRAVAAAVFALKADREPGKRILMNCPYKPYGPADFRAYVGLFLSDDARLTLERLQTKARLKSGAQRSHVGRP